MENSNKNTKTSLENSKSLWVYWEVLFRKGKGYTFPHSLEEGIKKKVSKQYFKGLHLYTWVFSDVDTSENWFGLFSFSKVQFLSNFACIVTCCKRTF